MIRLSEREKERESIAVKLTHLRLLSIPFTNGLKAKDDQIETKMLCFISDEKEGKHPV